MIFKNNVVKLVNINTNETQNLYLIYFLKKSFKLFLPLIDNQTSTKLYNSDENILFYNNTKYKI